MAELSLIPEKQKERALPRFSKKKKSAVKFNRGAKIATGALILVLVAGGAAYAWSSSLRIEERLLREEITALTAQRDSTAEQRLRALSALTSSFETLLAGHQRWSQAFGLIEDRVVPGAVFTSFEGNYALGTLALSGTTANYGQFAQQVRALEDAEHISRVDVSQVGLNREGRVAFSMQVMFKKDLITNQAIQ